MQVIWAAEALTPEGWARDVAVAVGEDGRIASVTPGAPRGGHAVDILIPAPANAHSHAFQRAMAGLTEARGPDPRDSFWTWRKLMYRFLDQMTPEQVEAVAALVQVEMLEAGYGACVEFHYLHHRPDGAAYDDLAEMSGRIAAAAAKTGIGLTLAPVFYQFGGCDRRPLGAGQVRFGCDLDRYARLHEGASRAVSALPADAVMGVAPHSLRAAPPEALGPLAEIAAGRPIHLHLAEQTAEVEEVFAAWGARPVEWLLANQPLSEQWCLIHCTQMEPHETTDLARTGAVAGLCPITESNLGDGIFDGVRWLEAGGAFAVGSDSNIRIALAEELRTLDYSQRLRDRTRAPLATTDASSGRRLLDTATAGGAKAAGRQTGRIAPGVWADLTALDASALPVGGDRALDSWIFAGDDRLVREVWSAGRHVVTEGRHRHGDEVRARYAAAVRPLMDAL